jgi:hypothetical protein
MELRSARRPLQHPKLMAEDEDLEVLASVVLALLATADEETGKGTGDEVEERQLRPIVPGRSERESGFPTLTGYPESLPNVEIAGRSGEARRVAQRVAGFGGPYARRTRAGSEIGPPARQVQDRVLVEERRWL